MMSVGSWNSTTETHLIQTFKESRPLGSKTTWIQALKGPSIRALCPGQRSYFSAHVMWDKFKMCQLLCVDWNYQVKLVEDVKWILSPTNSDTAHKDLKSPKRFTNLPLWSMSSILNLMGLMHSYRSPGVPQTPRSCNALIEVFKFIWDVETPIRSDPYLSQSHQDWGLWTFLSKVAECVALVGTQRKYVWL